MISEGGVKRQTFLFFLSGEKFSYGFKSLVKLGVWKKISKSKQVGGFFKFDTKLQVLERFLLFLSKKTTIF